MKYTVPTEKPITIEIEANSEIHTINFYPTDLTTRQKFYEAYENLKGFKVKEFVPTTDENGVSNAKLENTRELRRFTDFLAEQVDGIFGDGTAELLTEGRCNPSELVRFLCETAKYFTQISDKLIAQYVNAVGESGVMQ